MRRMKPRQAISEAILRTKRLATLLMLLVLLTACTPSTLPIPTATLTPVPATASSIPEATPTIKSFPTATPMVCRTLPGRLQEGTLDSFKPAQEFQVYLPPCYDEKTDERYPVLYLLHGQTYTDDQWIRLGAASIVDTLILSGESRPFIIVFPDDRYWNLEAGPGFGDRLVNDLIPYIDSTYRTLPDREHRAIGGMSRGAGWSLRLGLTDWRLFGTVGLHSVAVLQKDYSRLKGWIASIPPTSRPQVFMDVGDADPELLKALQVESVLNDFDISHEWHLYSGAHTEEYWRAHVEEYMRWYAAQWNN
jgi:enterochelin esterase-like enzyme